MAEILVKRFDNVNPDADKDGACYKRGYPVVVMPDGHEWGTKEGPPDFVIIKVPGVSVSTARQYAVIWDYQLDFTQQGSDTAIDGYRYKLWNVNISAGGLGGLTRSRVESYLSQWNAVIVSAAANEVLTDFSIFGLATSEGFLGADVTGVAMAESSYNKATGDHELHVDYSSKEWPSEYIDNRLTLLGMSVLDHDTAGKQIDYRVNRATVMQAFRDSIKTAAEGIYMRRRWYVLETGVAAAEAAGGMITVTPSELQSYLKDKLLE